MADMKAVEAGGLGKAVRRVEDVRFLTGRGNYTDDQAMPASSVSTPLTHWRCRASSRS